MTDYAATMSSLFINPIKRIASRVSLNTDEAETPDARAARAAQADKDSQSRVDTQLSSVFQVVFDPECQW